MAGKRIFAGDLEMQITAEGLEEQLRLLEQMPGTMNTYLKKAISKGNTLVKKAEIPRVKRFTGATADSIRSSVKVRGIGDVMGITGPSNKRAHIFRFMQTGREPGARMPWLHYLTDWVAKKWGLSGEEGEQAAYKLARAIHVRRIKGVDIAKTVLEQKRNEIIGLILKATDEIVKKMVVK